MDCCPNKMFYICTVVDPIDAHSVSSVNPKASLSFSMPSLLTLPRKLRHMIYNACLVCNEPIDLRRLQPERARHSSSAMHLAPNLLAVCRQIHEEASSRLYSNNTFYLAIVPLWTVIGPDSGALDPQYACLVCQRLHTTTCSDKRATLAAWNPRCRDIRQLRILVRPYSYLDWRYRVPDPCYVDTTKCQHGVYALLALGLRPSRLRICIARGAIFSDQDVATASNWYAVLSGYRIHDTQRLKRAAEQDLGRTVDLLRRWLGGADTLSSDEIIYEHCAASTSLTLAVGRYSGVRESIQHHVVRQCERMGDCLVAVSNARLLAV